MKQEITETKRYLPSDEEVVNLVNENLGWATSIAKSIARNWNLDWELDGLNSGAYEGLLFCAKRFDPSLGVPFRAYARKRIHEAATEEARKSKSWQKGVGCNSDEEIAAREISATLFDLYPELREGLLPVGTEFDENSLRNSVRQLLTSASLIVAFQESSAHNPENILDNKRIIDIISSLDQVHQHILYALYWQDVSMRSLAKEWNIDELLIVREHQEIVNFIAKRIDTKSALASQMLKVRRGLRPIALMLKKQKAESPFVRLASISGILIIVLAIKILSAKFI